MSLINRMLRDLSARRPAAGDVMSGIEVQVAPAPERRGSAPGRLALLAVLVLAFTGALWWLFGPRLPVEPRARGASAPTPVAAAPAATPSEPVVQEPPPMPPRAAPASAAREAPPPAPVRGGAGAAEATRLQMATELSTPVGEPARRPRRAAKGAPPQPAAGAAAATADAPATRGEAAGSEVAALSVRSASQASGLHQQGLRALERGDERAAENAFAQALGLDPKLHPAREELGKLRIRQGRLDDAARSVRRGLEEAPGWIGYRRLAARLELARGDAGAALGLLERGVPPVAEDTEYHGLLASSYQRLGRHEEASRAYRGLTEAQPAVAVWWAGYGLSRDALGDVAGALAAYDRARTLGGLDPRVLEHLNQRASALAVGG